MSITVPAPQQDLLPLCRATQSIVLFRFSSAKSLKTIVTLLNVVILTSLPYLRLGGLVVRLAAQ